MSIPSERRSEVLLVGATGFVGCHLYPALRAAGFRVTCTTRNVDRAKSRFPDRRWATLDVERGFDVSLLSSCRAVIYLVHQMGGGPGYPEREAAAARALRAAAAEAGVERIVYLGGVAPQGAASAHLQSRLAAGELLRAGTVPALELRAGMIVGAGSASWMIVRDLAKRLPAMLLPRWLNNRSSPVAVDDVIAALLWALTEAAPRSAWFDVPGPEVLSHRQLIERVARIMGKRPAIMEVPVVTPVLSSYWIALVTRIGLDMARELVQGLQSDLVPSEAPIWAHARGHAPLSLEEAARLALSDERSDEIPSADAIERLCAIGNGAMLGGPS
jgi:uncharacterized protein YbjT (DUF2867 family)